MAKILVIDANNLAFRNYHATTLCTSYGELVNIIYGTVNSLLFYNNRMKPDGIVFVWDTQSSRSWRKELFPAYKASRAQTASSDDFRNQVTKLKGLLSSLGIASVDAEGTEADDVIGYLARTYAGKKHSVVIVSSDGDFYQLTDDELIRRYHPTHEFIGPMADPKYGVSADKIVAFKALVGDSADEFKGVHLFGAKTAQKFFACNSGNVDDIWTDKANFDCISDNMATKILLAREEIMLYRDLATIDIKRGRIGELVWPSKDLCRVREVCDELEFNSILARRWAEIEALPEGGL